MIVSCIARQPLRKILDIPSDPINPKRPHELIPRLIRAMNRDYKNNLNNRTDNYYSYNFDQILDYLKRSGEYRNLSDNKTSFSSLIQRCQQWHKNLALRAANPNLIWESGTNQTTINGVQFTALNSHAQLIVEGQEMQHCVASYAHDCYTGYSRIYSLRSTDDGVEYRSTLELDFNEKDGSACIVQHQGFRNEDLPMHHHKAAILFAKTERNPIKDQQLEKNIHENLLTVK